MNIGAEVFTLIVPATPVAPVTPVTLVALGRAVLLIRKNWGVLFAPLAYSVVLSVASVILLPLGLVGRILLILVVDGCISSGLYLIENLLKSGRANLNDFVKGWGVYIWDIVQVSFILWVPLMLATQILYAVPNGLLILLFVRILVYTVFNVVPELIYQARLGGLEVLSASYSFVIENWIEWFLPMALLLLPLLAAPGGLKSFFLLSHRVGRGAGLDFSQILIFPFIILESWLSSLGVNRESAQYLILIFTPPLAVSILLFRGHLFASLSRSSHRQRQFASQFKGTE